MSKEALKLPSKFVDWLKMSALLFLKELDDCFESSFVFTTLKPCGRKSLSFEDLANEGASSGESFQLQVC